VTEPTPDAPLVMDEDAEAYSVPVTMTLSYRDLRFLERVTRMQNRKNAKALAKSTFVPEPGKRNVAEYTLARGEDLLVRLRAALNESRKGQS